MSGEAETTARWLERYGAVPPPWVAYPDTHPYSLRWRMGEGGAFLMLWDDWWEGQALEEAGRLLYFQRFVPPPRWLAWAVCALWDLDDLDEDAPELAAAFERAAALGLGTREAYEADLADPRWLEGG